MHSPYVDWERKRPYNIEWHRIKLNIGSDWVWGPDGGLALKLLEDEYGSSWRVPQQKSIAQLFVPAG